MIGDECVVCTYENTGLNTRGCCCGVVLIGVSGICSMAKTEGRSNANKKNLVALNILVVLSIVQ